MSSKSGIYQIKNLVTGKVYIGSACRLSSRKADHLRGLQRGNHVNQKLQRAWSKYGPSAFEFSVLELVDQVEMLTVREQHWIDSLNAVASGYNIAPVAGSQLGFRHSEQAKAAMSARMIGCKRSAESVAKQAAAVRGVPKSKEHAAKVGAALRGRKASPEALARMSAARAGVSRGPHTDETKAKISLALKGKKREPWTDEARAAHAAAVKPWNHTEETLARMRVAQSGKTMSEAARAKISAAQKLRATASEETRRKLSEAGKGRVFSDETRAKISAAQAGRKNGPMSEKAKAHRSALMQGKKWTPEQVAKRNATKAARRAEIGPQYGVRQE